MNPTEEMSFDRSAKLEETTQIVLNSTRFVPPGTINGELVNELNQAPSDLIDHAQSAQSANEFAEKCAAETLQLLEQSGSLASEASEQLRASYQRHLWNRADEAPACDILLFLLQQGVENPTLDESQFEDLGRWSNAVIEALKSQYRIAKLPFLNKTRPPSIYKEIPEIYQFCQTLMCPIVQAQQNDLVTITSINPVMIIRAGNVVAEMVEDAVGRRPIWFGAVCDAKTWGNLNRKHFGL